MKQTLILLILILLVFEVWQVYHLDLLMEFFHYSVNKYLVNAHGILEAAKEYGQEKVDETHGLVTQNSCSSR